MVPSDAFSSATRPGSGCCDAGTGVALGVAVLVASCPRAPAVKLVSAKNRKIRICFIIVSLVRRSYSNVVAWTNSPIAWNVDPGFFAKGVCISMGRHVVLNYLTVLHYKSNSLQLGNVSNRISSNGNEISKFPGLNCADAILPAQHFRGVGRNGTNHVEGGHPGFMQSRKS